MVNKEDKNPATGMFVREPDSSGGALSGDNPGTTASFGADFSQALAAASSITAEELDAIASLPSGSALLVVRRGPNTGARFLLDRDTTTIGRHPDADIFLDDVTVSRRHAEFRRSGRTFEIVDLTSLNGTYYDGSRIESAVVTDGAEVQVGKFRLTFYPSRLDLETPGA